MVTRVVLDLVEAVGRLPIGATVSVPVGAADTDTVAAWCARTGNELVSVTDGQAAVRRGHAPEPDLPPGRRPGARLWLYTNFDCNLACDYCCARSSPRTPRRALGLDRIRQLVDEAAAAGVTEVYLTGGEPFLLTDLDHIANACTARLPTTMLTNGILFRGSRLAMLRRMPRQRLTLQISLDSATPEPTAREKREDEKRRRDRDEAESLVRAAERERDAAQRKLADAEQVLAEAKRRLEGFSDG